VGPISFSLQVSKEGKNEPQLQSEGGDLRGSPELPAEVDEPVVLNLVVAAKRIRMRRYFSSKESIVSCFRQGRQFARSIRPWFPMLLYSRLTASLPRLPKPLIAEAKLCAPSALIWLFLDVRHS